MEKIFWEVKSKFKSDGSLLILGNHKLTSFLYFTFFAFLILKNLQDSCDSHCLCLVILSNPSTFSYCFQDALQFFYGISKPPLLSIMGSWIPSSDMMRGHYMITGFTCSAVSNSAFCVLASFTQGFFSSTVL